MSVELMMPSSHLILCHPLLLSSVFPSIKIFFSESALCIRWPKYCSFSLSPSNEYSGLISLGLTGLISLLSKGLSRVFFSTIVQKHWFFSTQPSLWSNSHICTWLLEKPWLWLYGPWSAKWCLCFLICCLGLYSFSSKEQASFNFIAAVIVRSDFGTWENKICHFSPSISHEVMGPDPMILVFWMLSFKPAFSLSPFTFIKGLFSFSLLSANRAVLSAYLRLLVLWWFDAGRPGVLRFMGSQWLSDWTELNWLAAQILQACVAFNPPNYSL